MKNKKGFTLVELLAVIVILGLLMIVAIPNVTRTIQNARRDTFVDNAKSIISAFRTQISSGNFSNCSFPGVGKAIYTNASNIELESGAISTSTKSSFGQAFSDDQYVAIVNNGTAAANGEADKDKFTYYYIGVDANKNGIDSWTADNDLKRASVKVGNGTATGKYDKAEQTVGGKTATYCE